MRRGALLALGTLLLAVAVGAALLAVDVRRWQDRLSEDDLRYRVAPTAPDLWDAPPLVPWSAARRLLGLDDDLRYRQAVRIFWRGEPRRSAFGRPRLLAYRAEAQVRLNEIAETDPDRRRASEAENLLGVLAFANAARDDALRATFLENGVASFQNAIALDPASEHAKYNLELALARLANETLSGETARGSGQRGGDSGAGAGNVGSGY